ncbi:biotin/lipoyl-containing protein [Streptomyces sp. NBC_00576]|uniref:biotin/lipoyl-containing protein n=1 Tax=Streptomyces sp. NBC_00576 TaxID=2903665 RepID=UPI002E80B136|nr:biotin/lipoyl-containing protein [Streptomyces sp. NBC_00576]WUB69343.1 biotin/lipoyl-binding protein [Streptomyces sp. NBC_00576]
MSHELRIPQLGVTMTEGEITEWLVETGDAVQEGQVLYVLATDKTETEIESPTSGTVEVLGKEGETYGVGTVMEPSADVREPCPPL